MSLDCNHRKGGILEGFPTRGTSNFYSIVKHRLPSGGLMAICSRCSQEWQPINILEKIPATLGWETAVSCETDNFISESAQFIKTIDRTAECHQQIENWVLTMARAENESIRRAGKISKLETEISKFHPKRFYERLKLALKILRGN